MTEQDLQRFSFGADGSASSSSSSSASASASASASSSGAGPPPPADPAADGITFRSGYSLNAPVCEGRLYLAWLTQQIRAGGGCLQQRTLAAAAELAGEGYDLVVDCLGLGVSGAAGAMPWWWTAWAWG
jgi:hypothetical protein